ncbi:MAG TPA: cytochrome c oxidase subunit II [Actinomycetota bacterium]|nr:cytochrome c oxidase subunit II [Actinomycetota bacterium]
MRKFPVGSKRGLLVALAALGVVLLSSCATNAPQDFLNHPEGPAAVSADHLWNATFLIAAVIFFVVEGLLIFAIIRFRERPGREAAQFHGNTKVEVLLTAVPALILAGLAIPTVRTIFDLAQRPDNALNVTVTARQFWWEFDYSDNDVITANVLHIPVDKPVYLTLNGEDVIHSFWVPRLAGKQDVVPGRTNQLTIEAPHPGVYYGQCTEYCGLSHANMRIRVIADSPSDFDAWLAEQQQPAETPTDPTAAEGQKVFLQGPCINCHAIEGTDAQARVGPDLTHFASRQWFAGAMFENTPENVSAWLADPPAVKPGSKMPDYGLSSDDIQKLVAYLESLK